MAAIDELSRAILDLKKAVSVRPDVAVRGMMHLEPIARVATKAMRRGVVTRDQLVDMRSRRTFLEKLSHGA